MMTSNATSNNNNQNWFFTFPRRLPNSRLGQKHDSLEAFHHAIRHVHTSQSKEYTLVVVTETTTTGSNCDCDNIISNKIPQQRILLGLKNRGFGMGMYNSFGGKFLDDEETVEACACRELEEETNIRIERDVMATSKVGIQRYTFDNDPVEMIMHVFRVDLNKPGIDDYQVKGCDEITPKWFDDINLIPFDNMFADDSLWLTTLLSSPVPMEINGSYHFEENCQETNTILHYHMHAQPKKTMSPTSSYTLEQRLFHALHDNRIHSPSIKEFKECYAFCNAVRTMFVKNKRKVRHTFDVVIDVAGGHGALAALFLVCTSATRAVVVDPANVGGGSVARAWGPEFIGNHKTLVYRQECLRTGLPHELENALTMTCRDRVLVVACHACQHLSEEILNISCRHGVHVAVMPCCQKDHSPGSIWKAASKNLSIPVAKVMDLLQCGKLLALGSYDVRLKMIDSSITPQNRIIVCRALSEDEPFQGLQAHTVDKAHSKLEMVYQKAHATHKHTTTNRSRLLPSSVSPVWYLALGFVAGAITVGTVRKK